MCLICHVLPKVKHALLVVHLPENFWVQREEELLFSFTFLSCPPSPYYCEMALSALIRVLPLIQIAEGILESNLIVILFWRVIIIFLRCVFQFSSKMHNMDRSSAGKDRKDFISRPQYLGISFCRELSWPCGVWLAWTRTSFENILHA